MTTPLAFRALPLVALTVAACAANTPSASSQPSEPHAATSANAPPAASTTPTADATPKLVLNETASEKLGTAPTGLGLKVGAKAPDATLPDIGGQPQRLSALYAEAPTFVVFYRGGWCPFCNLQLHGLATAKPDFDKLGVRIVAISVDKPEEEAKTRAKGGVPFPMLSDGGLTAHKAFNVVHVPSDAEAQGLAKYGVDLEKYSGQSHHNFAVPAIFLVDRSGVVRWEHVDEDYKTRPGPKQLLDVAARTLAKK